MICSRDEFRRRFGARAVIGMIHLAPLPGSPRWNGSMDEVVARAVADALALREGGAAAFVVENFGDTPFEKTVAPVTIAAMTRVVTAIAREVDLPFGINVLRNDGMAALAIAAATGASFVRVNVLTGAMVTDQGLIEGDAARIIRERARIAPEVLVFADHMVKHAAPLAPVDPLQSARDLRSRGMADVVVVTGRATGSPADPELMMELRSVVDAPLLVGSGLSDANAGSFAEVADGAIVGTSIKRGGDVSAPVDAGKVKRLVEAFQSRATAN